ncbi:MAG: hypothetical protein OHK93_006619 [Ramalina farinacea]|uniref:Uncharacterized protein n=1 Tax=Ramalina farinacea TaxID=258253 RepID=A0AA43TUR0_9LECA|nr:hypothetical protein [Ramalina farinacea]
MGRRSTYEDEHRSDKGMVASSLSSVIIGPVGYTGDASELGDSDIANEYQDQGVEFYQVVILNAQHMLSECLYFRKPTGCAVDVTEPKHKSRHATSKTPARVEDNFIVPDATVYEAILEDLEDQDQNELSPQSLQDAGKRAKALNFMWLAEILAGNAGNAVRGQGDFSNTSPGIEVAIDRIMSNLEVSELSSLPGIVTLLEMAGNNVFISDYNDAENRLGDLLSQNPVERNDQMSDDGERRPKFVPLPITATMRLGLGLPQEQSFRALYEALIKTHITPMTENMPGRARKTVERGIRSIAAELLLATFTIENPSGSNDGTFENQSAEAQELPSFNLPVRRKGGISQPPGPQNIRTTSTEQSRIASSSSPFLGDQTTSLIQPTPTLAVATPSPAETPDATAPTPAPPSQENTTPHCSLSSLVNFSTQPPLPSKLTETLQHWTIGADPALYDWAATQTAPTASQTEAETEDMSEPSSSLGRRKVKRRKMSRSMDFDRAAASGPRPSSAGLHYNNVTSASQPVPAVRLTESQPSRILAGGGAASQQ